MTAFSEGPSGQPDQVNMITEPDRMSPDYVGPELLISDEDRLVPKNYDKSAKVKQEKALRSPDNPDLFLVEPGTTWKTLDRDNYHPTPALIPRRTKWRIKGPRDPRRIKVYKSHEGTVQTDPETGWPLNTMGPTGKAGPLIKDEKIIWGPRPCVDGVVLRVHNGVLEMLNVQRIDGTWAFIGGGIDKGETANEAFWRESSEETGIEFDFSNKKNVYEGFSDDPRNRDNGWYETLVRWIEVNSDNKFKFKPQKGETLAVEFRPMNQENIATLFASQPHSALLVVQDWQNETGLVIKRDGSVGRAA